MKKFLLVAAAIVSSVFASAQKLTLNAEKHATKKVQSLDKVAESFIVNQDSKKSATSTRAGEATYLIELGFASTDGVHEEKIKIAETATVTITSTGESGDYKGTVLPKINISGFGQGYADVYGYIDDAKGKIYIPFQLCYVDEEYGEMYLEAIYADDQAQYGYDWGNHVDVVLTKGEDGNYVCWDGNEDNGTAIGFAITMTGAYDGELWTGDIENDYLVSNGYETGYYNFRTGWQKTAFPVYIESDGEEVSVYNFLGKSAVGMIIEDGEVFIPVGQPVLTMLARAYGDDVTTIYGEYLRTMGLVVDEQGNLHIDPEMEYLMASISEDGKTIAMGDDDYFTVRSKLDEEGLSYLFGTFSALSWTLYDGSFTDAIDVIKSNEKKDNAIYNIAGQRVEKAQKGLYIMGGQKVLVK